MKVIDLKEEECFVEQYVNLRNKYTELLLTSPVDISQTKEWIKRNNIEIRGLVQDNILLGVVVLYLDRDGEIAFFVKNLNKGVGSRLLEIIEEVAKEKRLRFVWAWVLKDNLIAQRVFDKNGFVKERITEREYKGVTKFGIKYKKTYAVDRRES